MRDLKRCLVLVFSTRNMAGKDIDRPDYFARMLKIVVIKLIEPKMDETPDR